MQINESIILTRFYKIITLLHTKYNAINIYTNLPLRLFIIWIDFVSVTNDDVKPKFDEKVDTMLFITTTSEF